MDEVGLVGRMLVFFFQDAGKVIPKRGIFVGTTPDFYHIRWQGKDEFLPKERVLRVELGDVNE